MKNLVGIKYIKYNSLKGAKDQRSKGAKDHENLI